MNEATEQRRAAARAARIMDKRLPSWFRRIVFSRLDLSRECSCIGGQTGLPWSDLADEYGSRFPDDPYCPFADNDLRDYWIDEVRARRRKVAAS